MAMPTWASYPSGMVRSPAPSSHSHATHGPKSSPPTAFRPRSGATKYAVELGKKLLTGTPLEPVVKRALFALTGNKNHLYDSLTVEIMHRAMRRDSNALDIGAFEGGMLRHILRAAPWGQHWAFEPLPDRYERLR